MATALFGGARRQRSSIFLDLSFDAHLADDALLVEVVSALEDDKGLQEGVLLLLDCLYLPATAV